MKKSYMNCGNEMKMKKWSPQWTQFMQVRKEVWKKNSGLQRGLNPLKSWIARFFISSFLFLIGFILNYLFVCNREVTGSNPVEVLIFFQASLRNCINCVHCDDHFFIFISFLQFIYDLFHISLTQNSLYYTNL